MDNKVALIGLAAIGAGAFVYFQNKNDGGGGGGGDNTFNLTTSFTPSNAGSISVDPPGGVYYPGDYLTITAHAAPGFAFNHWVNSDGSTSTSNPQVIAMPVGNLQVQAVFVASGTSGTVAIHMTVNDDPVYNYDPLVVTSTIKNNTNSPMVYFMFWNMVVNGIRFWSAERTELFAAHESKVFQDDIPLSSGQMGPAMISLGAWANAPGGALAGTGWVQFDVIP